MLQDLEALHARLAATARSGAATASRRAVLADIEHAAGLVGGGTLPGRLEQASVLPGQLALPNGHAEGFRSKGMALQPGGLLPASIN